MKKILSLALAALMLVSAVPTVFAAENNWEGGTQVTYTANQQEAYTVTVPAALAPSGSGDVVASGTWASNRKLTVTADANVTLTNSINSNDQKVLDVTFPGIALKGSNTAAVTDTKTVSVAAMPADALFGTWSGTFYYDVEMVDNVDLITFTIDGMECKAVKGMTWGEWLESDIEQDGWVHPYDFYVEGDFIFTESFSFEGKEYIIGANLDSPIIEGEEYPLVTYSDIE